jgi:hypothetical protein
MITATIIAVALGMTPVDADKPAQVVSGNYETLVGRYSQSTDRHGTTFVRGFDPRNGAPYELTINSRGDVEADIAEHVVNFRVQPAQ